MAAESPDSPGIPDGLETSHGPDTPPDDELSYEQARDELVETVRRLEAGGTTLEESLALWQRGERLAEVCQRWLDGARAKLDAAVQGSEEPQARTGGPEPSEDTQS
jgi:exodeoxyribonuclease VII small subunit